MQRIFYLEFMQSFLLVILFLVLVVERETRIQLFALVDKSLIARKCSWINRKHTTLKKVVDSVSKDAQEEV